LKIAKMKLFKCLSNLKKLCDINDFAEVDIILEGGATPQKKNQYILFIYSFAGKIRQ